MSQILTQEGRFKARPRSWSVEENRNTGTLQFVCAFAILEAFNGTAWEDWSAYDLEKTGYFYLSKKDGSPNEACIRSLREALGWDGVDLLALQETDWSGKTVQITTGLEEYEGQQRLKVRYINPEGWEGAQVKPLDAAALKALNARWAPKLRAVAPKGAPKPAAGTVKSPPAPARPAATPPPADVPGSTKESAWAKVLEVFGGNVEMAKQNWPGLLKKLIPNKTPSEFSAADWAAVEAGASEAVPF
jgi:hypothetical protein